MTFIKWAKTYYQKNKTEIVLLAILALRIFWFYRSKVVIPDGTNIKLSGRLLSEPIEYETSQRVALQGYKFYLPLYEKFSYGDVIVVTGTVEKDNLKSAKLVSVESGTQIFTFRDRILRFFQRNLPKDHAALVAGVVLGAKSGIGTDLWDKFKNSGTAHVVVASGMNVTLVSGFVMSFLLAFLKRGKAIAFALVSIWLYAILSGFDAPIVRACVMGTIAFTAQEFGKLNIAYRTTFLSAFLMLFAKPEWVEDIGFWLSFLATLSILRFEKSVEKKLGIIPSGFFKQDLATSLSAQIGVAPILYLYFGQMNVLSPLINAFVLWTIVPVTLIGMISGIVSFVFEPLAKLILFLSYPLTSWFLFVVNLTG